MEVIMKVIMEAIMEAIMEVIMEVIMVATMNMQNFSTISSIRFVFSNPRKGLVSFGSKVLALRFSIVYMATTPLNKIERAHQMYRDGRYEEALAFYTEALALAKTKAQKIALHSNRAACFLKLQDFKKAAAECTSVLELDHKHTGALMLRAQTLVTLKEYHSALFDVNRLMELNPSSEVYRNLEARLRTQLSLAPIPESEEESLMTEMEEESEEEEGEKERGKPIDVRADSNQNAESTSTCSDPDVPTLQTFSLKDSPGEKEKGKPVDVRADSYQNAESTSTRSDPEVPTLQTLSLKDSPGPSRAWEAIPKPKGHSNLDYSRWDKVEDDSSEDEEDEDDECQPQYRFRVRTVGVRSVK
ncbi:hypothetical protein NE237_031618 [Protea cynaroides]|uniref:Uncharacterized protein n=1 Tax=Protea cynaroides TaxID=273540 RepID=A0A9Q0L2T0_9MAGN|nr:hypothetical protein NE237_031618 [Protea cynaroides]